MKQFFLLLMMLSVLGISPGRNFAYLTPDPIPELIDPGATYLPIVFNGFQGMRLFGVESNNFLLPGSLISTRAADLGIGSVRLNDRISWRLLQPNHGDPINWASLSNFEAELRQLNSLDIQPIVIIDDYPVWATDNTVRSDGQPTSCGPIRDDRLADYADFVRALVERYRDPEFNLHNWELGNEPDVDPNLVPPNHMFGCYGKIADPYYGGERYGRMVKIIGKTIKAADRHGKVWLGGLLLDRPDSNLYPPSCGKPDCGYSEMFFEGILHAGAAPYFDVVPYHTYQSYFHQRIDADLNAPNGWSDWGGGYIGKAAFLRLVMARYGVVKPLVINETALNCPNDFEWAYWCKPPGDDFYQMQADYLVRSYVRGMSARISSFAWYTLNEAWRYGGLLDGNYTPKPSYYTYQQLVIQLNGAVYSSAYNYGTGIEAYSFARDNQHLHVIWSITDTSHTISLPKAEFIAAYTRDGASIPPIPIGSNYELPVQFEPIYLVRR